LFSVGVILISRFAGDVHLDTDAVLLGELAFAPFDRFVFLGYDWGPKAFYVMGGILLLNLLFIVLFYKELKLATFDPGLAAALSFSPGLIHYALMTLVSVTAVGAFDAVGSILVVALMIGPPAAAYLLTDRLPWMIGLSALMGVVSAISGYWLAHALDASIAGSMATMVGVLFGLALLLAPERGLVNVARRRARQRWEFAGEMLLVHLSNHEGTPQEAQESSIEHLARHMRWSARFGNRVVQHVIRRDLAQRVDGNRLALTDQGRRLAQNVMLR